LSSFERCLSLSLEGGAQPLKEANSVPFLVPKSESTQTQQNNPQELFQLERI
jgi:hypothetical protein